MAGEFKQCTNGHYYQGASCPYCKPGSVGTAKGTSLKTEVFGSGGNASGEQPTEVHNPGSGGVKTTVIDGQATVADPAGGAARGAQPANRTVFGDEDEIEIVVTPSGQQVEKQVFRSTRKLVGWLVTYSFDSMGVDYKLYEGRNTIGRDMDCNITVSDGLMSGKHATLLFRAGQYALKDEMSSHGTFANDQNIGFETYILNDGDVIRMGGTIFKFRTSL